MHNLIYSGWGITSLGLTSGRGAIHTFYAMHFFMPFEIFIKTFRFFSYFNFTFVNQSITLAKFDSTLTRNFTK